MGKHAEEQPRVTKHPKNKLDRLTKLKDQQEEAEVEAHDDHRKTWKTDAVIYLGHLPQGFEQEEMKRYFQQYGDVLAVKLCRSKKTGRSKGFGFIQFRYSEVAKIAAEAMSKFLICHTLEQGKPNPFTHKHMTEKTKFIDWKKIFVIQKNKQRTAQQIKKEVSQLLQHEEQKRTKLKEAGIAYQFPGFSEILHA